jgi:hypothetical protein
MKRIGRWLLSLAAGLIIGAIVGVGGAAAFVYGSIALLGMFDLPIGAEYWPVIPAVYLPPLAAAVGLIAAAVGEAETCAMWAGVAGCFVGACLALVLELGIVAVLWGAVSIAISFGVAGFAAACLRERLLPYEY